MEDRDAHAAVLVDVRVIKVAEEAQRGRHVRIVLREDELRSEESAIAKALLDFEKGKENA